MFTNRRLLIAVPIIMLMVAWVLFISTRPSADEVMQDFYAAEGRAEDMLIDPLILHSSIVAPVVIQEIKNPQMNKRRYAIAFLGNERIKEALPVLRAILADDTEKDYFRAVLYKVYFKSTTRKVRILLTSFWARMLYSGTVQEDCWMAPTVPIDAVIGRHLLVTMSRLTPNKALQRDAGKPRR